MKAHRSLRVLVLMLGLTLTATSGFADGAAKAGTTLFQDPPNPAEILEAIGEKPKIKYRGPKTRAIKILDDDSSPAATPPMQSPATASNNTPAQQSNNQVASPPAQPVQSTTQQTAYTTGTTQSPRQSKGQKANKKPKVSVAFPLTFAAGSATLTEHTASYVDSMAEAMKQKPEITYEIVGHTDITGGDHINIPLSLRRAEGVKKYLQDRHQIDPSRMTVAGMGSTELLIKENPKADENRRVEFVKTNY